MRRLVLGWLNGPDVAPREMVGVAAAGGFDAVGLRITGRKPGDGLPTLVGDRPAIADTRKRADDAGVLIHNVSAYHLYPEIALPDVEPVLDAAHGLGARLLVIGCYDADHVRFASRLAEIGDAAMSRDVRLALEFVPFSACKTLADAGAIVGAVARPNVGLVIDPLHLARSGGAPDDLRSVAPQSVFFLQLCDAPAATPAGVDLPTEARRMRLDPGDGVLPLAELFRAARPDIDVECEFPTARNLTLPPDERARAIRAAAVRFFAR